MDFRIQSIEVYVRENRGRIPFAIGDRETREPLVNPIGHVRMVVRDDRGCETFGCAADRLSVRWFDKRPDRSQGRKLRELVELIETGRQIWMEPPQVASPFAKWLACHRKIMAAGRKAGQEDLTSSFVSSLLERAAVDAACRLAGRPLLDMVRQDRLGFRPGQVHPELEGLQVAEYLPGRPVTRLHIRHTVGLADALAEADLPAGRRVHDGLPETLREYVRVDGVTHFKVKVGGNPDADLRRLGDIWEVIPQTEHTLVMFDANEAYPDLERFETFLQRLRHEQAGLWDHIAYIEQPLPRGLTLDPSTAPAIRRLAQMKPLVIDEADGTLDAFKQAIEIGYTGTSHKNCKGFFKSLLHRCLIAWHAERHRQLLLTAEDLQNLPVVPLHQDFVSVGLLGLTHCERNGHHYNYGLSMVSDRDKEQIGRHHQDLYFEQDGQWFLRIEKGMVRTESLHRHPFGVAEEPDWASMQDLRQWLGERG